MFSDQTSTLSAEPYMRAGLAILQPILIDNILDLPCSSSIGAQSCQALCPTIEKYGGIQGSELFRDFGGYSGKLGCTKWLVTHGLAGMFRVDLPIEFSRLLDTTLIGNLKPSGIVWSDIASQARSRACGALPS
jgi:hypothetical protein